MNMSTITKKNAAARMAIMSTDTIMKKSAAAGMSMSIMKKRADAMDMIMKKHADAGMNMDMIMKKRADVGMITDMSMDTAESGLWGAPAGMTTGIPTDTTMAAAAAADMSTAADPGR